MVMDGKSITKSVKANADNSAYQYHGVTLTSGKSALQTTLGGPIFGVQQDEPDAADKASLITIAGLTKVMGGGTFAQLDQLTVNTSGHFIKAVLASHQVCAIAMAAGSSGVISEAYLLPKPKQVIYRYHAMDLKDIADGDVFSFTPGFAGRIVSWSARAATLVTTGSKASTLSLEIGTTDVTGGDLALTSATLDAVGDVVDAAAITAANVFDLDDIITVDAASTTTFIEGSVMFEFVLLQE